MISLPYAAYMLQKPLHSFRHKSLKRRCAQKARSMALYEKALQELIEYTHEPAGVIEDKYRKLPLELNSRDFDALSEKELTEFYSHDRHYLYELPLWNAGSGRVYYFMELIFPYLRRRGFSRILDFGGGAGDLCMALSEYGFLASYCDVSRILADFARWRFKRRGVQVEMADPSDLGNNRFDCIVSFDVFEHPKNLPDKMRQIAGAIRPGGSLVFNIEFSGEGLHLKENKVYADFRKIDEALRSAGLEFDSRFKMFLFYRKK